LAPENYRHHSIVLCKAHFNTLKHLDMTHKHDSDVRTDIIVANAATNYVAQPKTPIKLDI